MIATQAFRSTAPSGASLVVLNAALPPLAEVDHETEIHRKRDYEDCSRHRRVRREQRDGSDAEHGHLQHQPFRVIKPFGAFGPMKAPQRNANPIGAPIPSRNCMGRKSLAWKPQYPSAASPHSSRTNRNAALAPSRSPIWLKANTRQDDGHLAIHYDINSRALKDPSPSLVEVGSK